ncbi:hypothetical protein FJZ53_02020 [Candidatus Woesearchaeota archaeon]|nr:hypothetical protein [Candidatus Woesearchaeota archaeon]
MRYVTNVRFRLPKYEQSEKIKRDLYEFLDIFKMAYGGVKIDWYNSKLPSTIFGRPKNTVKTNKEKANHVIVTWEGRRLIEFYYGRSKIFGYRLNGYLYDKVIEGLRWDESKKVIRMLERYNMKSYNIPFSEYGLMPVLIVSVLIILVIISIVRSF